MGLSVVECCGLCLETMGKALDSLDSLLSLSLAVIILPLFASLFSSIFLYFIRLSLKVTSFLFMDMHILCALCSTNTIFCHGKSILFLFFTTTTLLVFRLGIAFINTILYCSLLFCLCLAPIHSEAGKYSHRTIIG